MCITDLANHRAPGDVAALDLADAFADRIFPGPELLGDGAAHDDHRLRMLVLRGEKCTPADHLYAECAEEIPSSALHRDDGRRACTERSRSVRRRRAVANERDPSEIEAHEGPILERTDCRHTRSRAKNRQKLLAQRGDLG